MEVPPRNHSRKSPVPSTQTPTSGSHQTTQTTQRLRLSCDACAAAKVKCDKTRPCCGRCARPGTLCVYGLSKKYGKSRSRSGKGNMRRVPTIRDVRPRDRANSIRSGLSGQERQRQLKERETDVSNPDLSNSTSTSMSSSGNQFPRGEMTIDSSSFTVDEPDPFPNHMWPYPTNFPQTSYGHPICGYVDTVGTHEAVPLISPPSINFHGFRSPDTAYPVDTPAIQPPHPSDGQFPVDWLSMDPRQISEHYSQCLGPHSCYALANSTLASLHHPSYPSITVTTQHGTSPTSCPSSPFSPLDPTPTPVIPTLYHVLRSNKVAVNNVQRLLKCPCAGDPHLAMLFASIIAKVLMWYQVVSDVENSISFCSSSGAIHTPCSGSDPTMSGWGENQGGLCSSRPSSISLLPNKKGEFGLDEEDQQVLSRQLLLSELAKAGHVIDRLATVDFAAEGDDVDGRIGLLNAILGGWLKTELFRTLKGVEHECRRQEGAYHD